MPFLLRFETEIVKPDCVAVLETLSFDACLCGRFAIHNHRNRGNFGADFFERLNRLQRRSARRRGVFNHDHAFTLKVRAFDLATAAVILWLFPHHKRVIGFAARHTLVHDRRGDRVGSHRQTPNGDNTVDVVNQIEHHLPNQRSRAMVKAQATQINVVTRLLPARESEVTVKHGLGFNELDELFARCGHTGILLGVDQAFFALAELFERGPIAVITGAGMSTDSGIPDYRGEGSPARTPISISDFLGSETFRRRFWAGARVGALHRRDVTPNRGHYVLAAIEDHGWSTGVITQNVDNLHREAGTQRLTELHGNGAQVVCVNGHGPWLRRDILARFDELNPGYAQAHKNAETAPDGDAIVSDYETVTVPQCEVCGGVLRPKVVYFGETVAPEVFEAAAAQVRDASALLCVGTSLAVNTAVRLVNRATDAQLPVAIINRGPTALDHRADIRIEGGASESLSVLFAELIGVPVEELENLGLIHAREGTGRHRREQ